MIDNLAEARRALARLSEDEVLRLGMEARADPLALAGAACRRPAGDRLDLRLIEGGPYRGEWLVLAPYVRQWHGRPIAVPAGFVTDGPSVPPRLRSFLPVRGWMWPAAVCHDYAYVSAREGGQLQLTRAEADAMFFDLLKADGVGWLARNIMWAAVRLGGWWRWQGWHRPRVDRGRDMERGATVRAAAQGSL